jgi:phosphate transport system substrate-binding protein
MRRLLTLAILSGAVIAAGWVAAAAAEINPGGVQTLRLQGTPSCYLALSGLAEAYTEEHPGLKIDFGGAVASMGVTALKEGRADAAYVEWPLREILGKMWPSYFPDIAQPGPEWTFAQTALGFVVNKGNRAAALNFEQICAIWSGAVTKWSQVGGSGTPIVVYTIQPSRQLAGSLLSDNLLDYRKWRKDLQNLTSNRDVIGAVAKDPNGIGIIVIGPTPPVEVKLLSVAKDSKSQPVPPTVENIVLGKYPVVREFRFVFSDKSPPEVREFCRFAVSEAAAEVIRENGYFPRATQNEMLAAQRLEEMRAGKGVRIEAAGSVYSPLLKDLATEYVKAKAVVQMQYAVADEAAAVGQFLGGKELLLLQGPPGEATLRAHGARWTEMKAEIHAIAGRAVAVVTSIVNKEETMTPDRIRSIFAGEVGQWGDSPAMAQKDIHCYGLSAADPMTALFFSGVMRGTRCKNLQPKKDTAGVLAALALDPQGIAFVDLAAIPQDSTAVRVVAVGPAGTAVKPNGKTLADGTYPLSKPLVLYVSPRASETTKDFVRFILSGACDAVFRQHGFVPTSQPPPAP